MKTPAATVLYEADPELLDKLLSALWHPKRLVYIYANGPTSPDIDGILNTYDNLHVIRSAQNEGHAVGLNAIMDKAFHDGAKHIVLFDQDSTPELDFVDKLSAAFETCKITRPALAAVGPKLVPPAGEDYLPIRYEWRGAQNSDSFRDVFFLPTSGTLVSIAAWRDVGRFREDYFIGGIDVEWGLRALDRGYRSAVAMQLPLVHRWGIEGRGTSGARHQFMRQPTYRLYLYVRNTAHTLTLPHVPWTWKVRHSVRLLAQIAVSGLLQRRLTSSAKIFGRAIQDGWRARLGPPPEASREPSSIAVNTRKCGRLAMRRSSCASAAPPPDVPPTYSNFSGTPDALTCGKSALTMRASLEATAAPAPAIQCHASETMR
jgi:rhamnosyltransferase